MNVKSNRLLSPLILTVLVAVSAAIIHPAQAGPAAGTPPKDQAMLPFEGLSEGQIEGSIHGHWDSHYVSEGRDNLDGHGLIGSTFEFAYEDFSFTTWYVNSPGVAYSELHLYSEYGFDLGPFEAYVGYNHLRFPHDNAHDNELGTGLALPDFLPGGLVPAIDWYYSVDAGGSFMEASVRREFPITDVWTITAATTLGFNDGYIGDGHNGANHFAVVLSSTYDITDRLHFDVYVSQTWAIDSNPVQFADDAILRDLFFGGVALALDF